MLNQVEKHEALKIKKDRNGECLSSYALNTLELSVYCKKARTSLKLLRKSPAHTNKLFSNLLYFY